MKKRGWGRVINVASIHGLVASPYKSAYVAAKHGVIGFTKAVALEVAELGITANAICPGYVWTSIVEKQLDDQVKVHGMPKEKVISDIMLAPQPTKRFIKVEEVAQVALNLADEAAGQINGAAMVIDGGWTAR
jgi:3-hydroxybutyrate dehydrogenase